MGVGAFEPKQHDTATRGNKNRKENSLDCLLRNHYVNGPFYQTSHNNFAKLAVPVSKKKQTREDVVTALQSTKLRLGLQLPYLATRPWKFRKPSMQWAAGHLLTSPSGGPWVARQTTYKWAQKTNMNFWDLQEVSLYCSVYTSTYLQLKEKNKTGHQGFMLPSRQGTYWSATESQRKRLCMKTILEVFFPDNTLYILETTKTSRWEYTMLSEAQNKETHVSQRRKTLAYPPNFPCFC